MIRIGVIGTGRVGIIHAHNFARAVPHATLAWLVDPDEISRLNAAREVGLNANHGTTVDYREALKDERLDAVVIAMPTAFHKEIVVAAAEAGKHVLCEKPMALNAEECDEMTAACDAARVKLQIGFMRRFDAGFRDALARLQAGEIGELVHVRSLTHGPSIPKPWMFDMAQSNGPLAEVNSHDIDTVRWFADDDVAEVYAMAGNFRSPEARDAFPDFYDQIHLSMKFHRGAQGSISGAQGVRYAYDARAEIIGTEGILFVGGLRAPLVTCVNRDREIISTAVGSWRDLFADAYLEEDRAFVRSILDDSPSPVTGHDGKEAVKIVVAGNRSAKDGNVTQVDRS
jgi:predicted dehydrogenase